MPITPVTSIQILLLRQFLGEEGGNTSAPACSVREAQRDDGSWSGSLDNTVLACMALRRQGDDPGGPRIVRARRFILDHGGAESTTGSTRVHLACFGQIPWSCVDAPPPEFGLLAWRWGRSGNSCRHLAAAICMLASLRPIRPPPRGHGIDDSFVDWRRRSHPGRRSVAGLWGMLARLGGTPMSRLCREALLAEAVTTPSADVPLDALVLLRMAVDHHGSSGADHSAVDEAIALAGCSGSDRHDPRASPTLAKLPPKTASIRTGTAP